MKFRIIKNRFGKFQPQRRWFGLWWNFYSGYSDYLEQFDDIENAEDYIKFVFKQHKECNQIPQIIKEYKL